MSAIDPIAEAEAVADWKAGDILAGGRLLKMHAGLIHAAVRRYVTDRCELDDLLQVGRMALLDAAMGLDVTRGSLAVHATCTMRRRALRYMRSGRHTVKVSEEAQRKGVICARTVWLDAPIGDGDSTLLDLMAAPTSDDVPALDLVAMIADLPDGERYVMQRLCETPAPTLTAIGLTMGVTVSAVYKTRERAIARIRVAIERARSERAGGAAALADELPRSKCVDCPRPRQPERIRCPMCAAEHARKAREATAAKRQAA